MSDDESVEQHNGRMHELRMGYPEKIEFLMGPYCGNVLYPHQELMTDVHRIELGDAEGSSFTEMRFSRTPWNFLPIDTDRLVLVGHLGSCLYVEDEITKVWSFQEYVEVYYEKPDA